MFNYDITKAFEAVTSGFMSISAAAKKQCSPDRVSGILKLAAKMSASTYLSSDDEISLCSYNDYMVKRGFHLSIDDIKGFVFAIV